MAAPLTPLLSQFSPQISAINTACFRRRTVPGLLPPPVNQNGSWTSTVRQSPARLRRRALLEDFMLISLPPPIRSSVPASRMHRTALSPLAGSLTPSPVQARRLCLTAQRQQLNLLTHSATN